MSRRYEAKLHLVDKGRLLGAHLAVLANATFRILAGKATPGPPVTAGSLHQSVFHGPEEDYGWSGSNPS
jgi:hypothetical protein